MSLMLFVALVYPILRFQHFDFILKLGLILLNKCLIVKLKKYIVLQNMFTCFSSFLIRTCLGAVGFIA